MLGVHILDTNETLINIRDGEFENSNYDKQHEANKNTLYEAV